jgi:hypothetical protein
MKAKNRGVLPKALREVWEWKDAVYRETEGMTTSEALNHIHSEVEGIRKAFGLRIAEPLVGFAGVAEERSDYGTKRP